MIRAGMLRHRVTIQAQTSSEDSIGQPIKTWHDVGTYWAAVIPLRGREAEQARQIKAEATHKVVLRGIGRVTPEMRLLFKGRILDVIEALDREERGRELNLLCVERY